jgi:putative spermidine/putrescine transport system substrate-binding protein
MRRKILLSLTVLILVAGAAFWWWSRPLPVLNVVTWPGAYGRAQAAAQMQAYGTQKHVDVRIQQWADNGTLDELRRAITTHRAGDVVDLELPVAVAACKAGLLEPIDAAALPAGADGTPAAKDFINGMTGRCFVASAVYAQMIVCQPCRAGVTGDLAALFALVNKDTKIALQKQAKVNLEMALLADGVKPADIYGTLSTEAGLTRAFAKLNSIKPSIVWWSNAAEPIALLKSGQVKIATALTADVQAASQATPMPLFLPQFYEADVLAIPKGDAKKEMALDYIHFATGAAPLAAMTQFAPYAPPRRSAQPLVTAMPAGPTRDFVAAQQGMLLLSFAIDDTWWDAHGPVVDARFRDWLAAP